jgi:large subunit ribosomal protein L19e
MSVRPQKEIAAKMLKVGKNRVWIDPDRIDDVTIAIRRADIKKLIDDKIIVKKPKTSISRGRIRIISAKKKAGRRIGPGTRKGKKGAISSTKQQWMMKIRRIRSYLKMLRERRLLTPSNYRILYLRAKGGTFDSIAQLKSFISQNRLLRRSK